MNPRYPAVAQRAGHHCEYCRAPESVFNFPFEVEHIQPPSCGGLDAESNWALACRSCNLHKSVHLEGLDTQTGMLARLYNPRKDEWEDHFRLDRASGLIVGRTNVGRGTVERLRMNSPAQVSARRQWLRLELLPRTPSS